MCKPISEGGQRCAAHTRTAFRHATPGTREWDDAAAAYASTPTGRRELQAVLDDLQTTSPSLRSPDVMAAVSHALQRGTELREQTVAVKRAISEAAERATKAANPGLDEPPVDPSVVFDDLAAQSEPLRGYLSARRYAPPEWRTVTDRFLLDAATQAGWNTDRLLAWANDLHGQLFAVVTFANHRVPNLDDRLTEAVRRGYIPK